MHEDDIYTVKNVDEKTGNVMVVFAVDDKEQTLSGVPLDNVNSFDRYIRDYEVAYREGLRVEQPEQKPAIDPDILALVKSI